MSMYTAGVSVAVKPPKTLLPPRRGVAAPRWEKVVYEDVVLKLPEVGMALI